MIRVKLGLFIVGAGETIADAGARIAGCRRLRSYLYPRALAKDVHPVLGRGYEAQ